MPFGVLARKGTSQSAVLFYRQSGAEWSGGGALALGRPLAPRATAESRFACLRTPNRGRLDGIFWPVQRSPQHSSRCTTVSGRRTNFFWHGVLPHKCGVPPGYGTPHLCRSEELCRAPTISQHPCKPRGFSGPRPFRPQRWERQGLRVIRDASGCAEPLRPKWARSVGLRPRRAAKCPRY